MDNTTTVASFNRDEFIILEEAILLLLGLYPHRYASVKSILARLRGVQNHLTDTTDRVVISVDVAREICNYCGDVIGSEFLLIRGQPEVDMYCERAPHGRHEA